MGVWGTPIFGLTPISGLHPSSFSTFLPHPATPQSPHFLQVSVNPPYLYDLPRLRGPQTTRVTQFEAFLSEVILRIFVYMYDMHHLMLLEGAMYLV